MDKASILVVEDSEMTLFKLKAILLRLGYNVITQTSGEAALDWLQASGTVPNLIISDVNMPGMNGYDFIRKVRANATTARVPLMLLTSQNEMSDKVAGLQAGADDYVAKTVTPTELDLRVKALLARVQGQEGSFTQFAAKMITVFNLRGGVGTTTLAINLSIALTQMWGIEVGLWDMALSGAHCAFMLNLKPKNTLVSLTDWKEQSVDDEVIDSFILTHESGIHLMPGPLTVAEAELVTPHIIDLVLPYMESRVAYLVVDGGNHFTEPVLTLLERSEKIVVPLAPELASVKSTFDLLQIFDQLGIDPAKVYPVINTIFPANPLSAKRIEGALHKTILADIPHDSDTLVNSINTGRPAFLVDPKSAVSTQISALAYKLTSGEMEGNQNARPSALVDGIRKLVKSSSV
jgi:pilus assembly protein CpaE